MFVMKAPTSISLNLLNIILLSALLGSRSPIPLVTTKVNKTYKLTSNSFLCLFAHWYEKHKMTGRWL